MPLQNQLNKAEADLVHEIKISHRLEIPDLIGKGKLKVQILEEEEEIEIGEGNYLVKEPLSSSFICPM